MCTQPLKIKNPKLKSKLSTFNAEIDPIYIYVPCGRCQECQNKKKNDWIVRLANEYQFTKERGGFTIMETFTYNEQNIPHLFGKYAFSKEHYKTFMKKLREYLERHFLSQIPNLLANMYSPSIGKTIGEKQTKERENVIREMRELYPELEPSENVKVFWVSEYGGEYGRPHYHAIFNVTMKITPYEFREYVRKAWIYGFTDKRLIENQVIHSFEGIYYVAKYVNKTTLEFIQNFATRKDTYNEIQRAWYTMTGEELDWESFYTAPIQRINEVCKRLNIQGNMPFIRVSNHYGLAGIKHISQDEWIEGKCKILDKKKGYKLVNIPEYYKRKYMYDYDKISNTFSLNDRGILLKQEWAKSAYERNVQEATIILEQLAENYAEELNDYEINFHYLKKVWEDYKNKRSIAHFVDILQQRQMLAQQHIIKKYEYEIKHNIHNWNEKWTDIRAWEEIINDASRWCKYTISPYWDNLSKEANWISHQYEINEYLVETHVTNVESYLLKVYDKIKSIYFTKRGEYLHKMQIEAERQKQIKNQQKPNVT